MIVGKAEKGEAGEIAEGANSGEIAHEVVAVQPNGSDCTCFFGAFDSEPLAVVVVRSPEVVVVPRDAAESIEELDENAALWVG